MKTKRELEMEAGRRAVERASASSTIKKLKGSGLIITRDMDASILAANLALAAYAGKVPDEHETRQCPICGGKHIIGERCPNRTRR